MKPIHRPARAAVIALDATSLRHGAAQKMLGAAIVASGFAVIAVQMLAHLLHG